ncbi:MAG: gfo/Idh/MocA family oxidoreductase, partial [Candidatus Aminicenantes bacterium]|nr:gfo/Idh/MocA family oxidoreductase [Candidatus Aminicenantes bacterium]
MVESSKKGFNRRQFLTTSAGVVLGVAGMPLLRSFPMMGQESGSKMRVALVGTGIRGSGLWGKTLIRNYGDILKMVGL